MLRNSRYENDEFLLLILLYIVYRPSSRIFKSYYSLNIKDPISVNCIFNFNDDGKINKCVFGSSLDKIDYDRIDSDRIDYDKIDFERIDLCLETIMYN